MRKLLIIACLLSAAVVRSEESPEKPAKKIPVVKTWKELCAQPEIDMGGGVKIHLGIEALRAPGRSGVLIYCIADGYDKVTNNSDDLDSQLGPVKIRVEQRGNAKQFTNFAKVQLAQDSVKARRAMFVQVVPVTTKAIYDLTVLDPNDKPLAACEIEGTDEAAPVWSPLKRDNKVLEELQSADETPVVRLRYDGTAAAVPKFEGWAPLRWESPSGQREPVDFGDNDPLPNLQFPDAPKDPPPSAELIEKVRELVPKLGDVDFESRERAMSELEALGKPARVVIAAEAKTSDDSELRARARKLSEVLDGDFTVRLSGKDFLLKSSSGMETTFMEDSILARWWVNGKPFVPGPAGKIDEEGGLSGSSQSVENILLKLDVEAAKLGAKSGDKVAVQFLYCPTGVQRIDEQMEMLAHRIRDAADNLPRVSNKLEFTAP